MTTVKVTRMKPVDPGQLFWQGEGVDTETGEVVVFGGTRDEAEPLVAALEAGEEKTIVIEPVWLELERRKA